MCRYSLLIILSLKVYPRIITKKKISEFRRNYIYYTLVNSNGYPHLGCYKGNILATDQENTNIMFKAPKLHLLIILWDNSVMDIGTV